MKLPFNDLENSYKRKVIFTVLIVMGALIALFLLYNMIPGIKKAWVVVGNVAKPLVLGLVLCYLLYPMVGFFESRFNKQKTHKWSRPLAVLIVFLILDTIITSLIVVLVWMAAKQIVDVDFSTIISFVENMWNSADSMIKTVQDFLKKYDINIPVIGDMLASGMKIFISGTTNIVSSIFFGTIFSIYFLIDGKNIYKYWHNVASAFARPEFRKKVKGLLKEADGCFSGYIRGQMIDAIIVGVVTSFVFLLIGMPYALVIGLLTGVGNMIPYVGPILGYGSVLLINIINYDPKKLISGLVVLIVIMFLDGNVLNPRLLAGTVKVHPLLVVAALLCGGAAGGLLGMLLAVPSAAFVKIQFDKLVAYKKGLIETREATVNDKQDK